MDSISNLETIKIGFIPDCKHPKNKNYDRSQKGRFCNYSTDTNGVIITLKVILD
jgi:hypothetical protein